MSNGEQLAEVRIDGQAHRGLWAISNGVMTVRVGGSSKSARVAGMENYPETFARWLIVKLLFD